MISHGYADAVDVVREGLSGRRDVDQQVMESVSVLTQRLERLKAAGGLFGKISFSPQMKALAAEHLMTTAGIAV